MNIIENAEKECAVLGTLFQGIVNEMKVCIDSSDDWIVIRIREKDRAGEEIKNMKTFQSQGLHASMKHSSGKNDYFTHLLFL